MLRPQPTFTLFPYTTLFRSLAASERNRSLAVSRGDYPVAFALEVVPQGGDERGLIVDDKDRACGCVHTFIIPTRATTSRSEEHTSELQSRLHLVCRLLLEKK